MSWRKKATESYIGIDIGSDQIEVSRIRIDPGDHTQSQWQWSSQYSFKLRELGQDFHTVDWVEDVAEQLIEYLPRCVDQAKPMTILSVPPSWIHYQTSMLDEIDQARTQCDQIFGSSLFQSKSHVAHWPIHGNPTHHQVAAVSQSAAIRLASAVSSIGYRVRSIMPPATAILKSATALTGLRPAAVILLDPLIASIAIDSEGDSGLCRSVPAPETVRESAAEEIELTPWIETIASEFHSTMRFARRLGYKGVADAPILICGRYAESPGVAEMIARLTQRPTAAWGTCFSQRPRSVDPGRDLDPQRALSLSLAYANFQMSTEASVR